jgi:SAM-dependent methyltransferase
MASWRLITIAAQFACECGDWAAICKASHGSGCGGCGERLVIVVQSGLMGGDVTRWSSNAGRWAGSYDDRWAQLIAQGDNIHGEADFVESLRLAAPMTVLDAGCGTGRVAIELARRGLTVVGVDLDAAMLQQARDKAPHLEWIHGDVVDVDLGRRFNVVVLAGNVMIFLAPGTEAAAVANMASHLEPGGVLVAGFQLRAGGLDLADYDRYAAQCGLTFAGRWATWDRQPFVGGSYAVSVHRLASPA